MREPLFAARLAVIIFVQTAALFRIYGVINTAERPYFRQPVLNMLPTT